MDTVRIVSIMREERSRVAVIPVLTSEIAEIRLPECLLTPT